MRASSQTDDGQIQREWLATGGLYVLEGLVVLLLSPSGGFRRRNILLVL